MKTGEPVWEKPYNFSPTDIKLNKEVDPATALMIEGYAMACADLMRMFTGDSPSSKWYDPMLIRDGEAHSYAFEMRDGGRHHDLSLFDNVGDIMECLAQETKSWIEEDTV